MASHKKHRPHIRVGTGCGRGGEEVYIKSKDLERYIGLYLDRCDRMIRNESRDPNGGNVCLCSTATCRPTSRCKLCSDKIR